MMLIIAFAITVVIGDLMAIGVCSIVERFSEMASLILFLILFAGVFPLAWRFAVHVTEPTGLPTRLWNSARS
jgi:hypothetical protein